MSHWFDATHNEYEELEERWRVSQDHYEAEVIDKANDYLVQREQGESSDAFDERVKISDYLPLQGHVIDSLAGMLFGVEEKAERRWEDPDSEGTESLGDPTEADTVAFSLTNDSDGRGTDWTTKWKGLAIDIIVNNRIWVLVDGKSEGRPHASVKIINPLDVTDWVEDRNGRLIEVKVRDEIYDRDSVMELEEAEDCCTIYSLDGWERHKKVIVSSDNPNEDDKITTEKIGEGRYHFEDREGNRILPIYRVELPIRRFVAWILAKKNNAIFNKESAKDFLEWVACFQILNVFGDDELFSAVKEALSKGNRVLQNRSDASSPHSYESPSIEPAQRLADSLKEKVEMFLFVAYQQFSDSAREKTATEVRQDLSRGIGAFLELLKGAVDEAENNAFWRIEQVYFPAKTFSNTEDGEMSGGQDHPENRQVWGQAMVERSSDFMPIDIENRIRQTAEMFFGAGPVPLTKKALVQAALDIAAHFNIEADPDELEQVIENKIAQGARSDDFNARIDAIVNGG